MRQTYLSTGIILTSLFCFATLMAQSYDLSLVLVNTDGIVGGNFDVKIKIRSVGGTFGMGTSNLVFTYNKSALSNPTLKTAHNFSGGFYNSITVTQPSPGRVSTNIELFVPNNGTTIEASYMSVATISFTIEDLTEMSEMSWRTSSPNPTIVFVDNESEIASPNSLSGLNVPMPVELSSFTVKATERSIKLTWRTETETQNFGFHIYRSLEETGDYARINAEIIRGAGTSSQPHRYSYDDPNFQPGNTYYYKLADVDFNGNMSFHGPVSVTIEALPEEYTLEQNYPNPFNPETTITFSLKDAGRVSLCIYNLKGQLINALLNAEKQAGIYSIKWNGTNCRGDNMPSGTYFYILKVNGFSKARKLIFIK